MLWTAHCIGTAEGDPTYSRVLTILGTILSEKLTVVHLVNKVPACHAAQLFIIVFTPACHPNPRHWLPSNILKMHIHPLNAELNPICHLLALLEARHILHVSGIRVNIILPHVPLSFKLLRVSSFPPGCSYAFPFPVMYATRPVHLIIPIIWTHCADGY